MQRPPVYLSLIYTERFTSIRPRTRFGEAANLVQPLLESALPNRAA